MSETLRTYCPTCDREVDAALEERREALPVRGEMTEYDATVAVCPVCGETVGDSRVESVNLTRAYDAYRRAHGMLASAEISALRADYGLSLREFARFLGFGDQTYARYERGALQDQTHDRIMRAAMTVDGARALLDENRGRLSDASVAKVEAYIRPACAMPALDLRSIAVATFDSLPTSPDATNGFRLLDLARLSEMVRRLAEGCGSLFVTKLQKAAFFCDFACCARLGRSMTGLQYARITYGPVMQDHGLVLDVLRSRGVVDTMEADNGGEIVAPGNGIIRLSLTPDELAVIDDTVAFVNTFHTASSISRFSHELNAWKDGEIGTLIDYTGYCAEVAEAMETRLRPPR